MLNKWVGNKWFLMLDLVSGYWLIKMDEIGIIKIDFIIYRSLF